MPIIRVNQVLRGGNIMLTFFLIPGENFGFNPRLRDWRWQLGPSILRAEAGDMMGISKNHTIHLGFSLSSSLSKTRLDSSSTKIVKFGLTNPCPLA